jgi:copper chaperone
METTTLTIAGMSCGHCVKAVEAALGALEGVRVRSVEVGTATVSYDPAVAGPERLAAAVEEEGYQVLDRRSGG